MYIRYSNGPRTLPWGTQEWIGYNVDVSLQILLLNVLLDNLDLNG